MNIDSAVQYYESYAKQVVLPRLRSGLRIVHVAPPWIEVPPIRYGGTEIVVERVATGQQKLGLNVAVLCRSGSTVPGAVHIVVQRREWRQQLAQSRHDEIELFYAAKCVKWMKAELDAGHPIDIIHTHVRGAALLYICREFAEAKGIPVVHTVHLPVVGAEWMSERERYREEDEEDDGFSCARTSLSLTPIMGGYRRTAFRAAALCRRRGRSTRSA